MDRSRERILNGAPSQYQRRLRLLEAAQPRVDERSFPELLDFAVRFGELVWFYDLHNQVDGDWMPFFLTDPTMVLAALSAPGRAETERRYRDRRRRTREERDPQAKVAALRATAEVILQVARRFDAWFAVLSRSLEDPAAQRMARELAMAIEATLRQTLQTLKAYDEGAAGPLGRPLGLDFEGFLPIWRLQHVTPDGSIYRGRNQVRKIDHSLPFFDPLLTGFLQAIGDLVAPARGSFEASLERSDHKAQIALFMAFARLFESAQESVNTLSSRYQRFYYHDVLRGKARCAVGDRLWLTFGLADDEDLIATEVPRGTLFPAGEDVTGREILYAAETALTVTTATLARILTLRAVFGPLWEVSQAPDAPAEVAPPMVERGFLASEIAPAVTPEESVAPWSTFGERTLVETPHQSTEPATLGFGLASGYLELRGGERRLTVTVTLTEASGERLRGLLDALSQATGRKPLAIFQEILMGAFDLSLSTAEGWLEVETYRASAVLAPAPPDGRSDPTASSFSLHLTLPSTAPGITAFDPTGNEETGDATADSTAEEDSASGGDEPAAQPNPAPQLPTLEAFLRNLPVEIEAAPGNSSVRVLPHGLLAGLRVRQFEIFVDVHGLTGLQLSNTDGEIDPTVPFPVFGGIPAVGSFLEIRQAELFRKTLETLRLEIDWLQLPQNEDGFLGYYRDYRIGLDGRRQIDPPLFDNQSFRGRFRIEHPGTWNLQAPPSPEAEGATAEPVEVFLFRAYPGDCWTSEGSLDRQCVEGHCRQAEPPADGHLCPRTSFDDLVIEASGRPLPPYYDPAAGAIRLQLNEPPYGFGNDLYASNVLNSVIQDLPDADGCLEKCAKHCASEPKESYGECMAKCMEACMRPKSELRYPNAPYLPQAETLSLHYTARCTIPMPPERVTPAEATPEEAPQPCGRVFYLTPFGGWEPIEPWTCSSPTNASLLPRPARENLFLGFQELPPRQPLSLLFELVTQPTGRGRSRPLPPVEWQVLSGDRWRTLCTKEVPVDSTDGLESSGIVHLALPDFRAQGHTSLPSELQWLRAGIVREAPGEASDRKTSPRRRQERFPKSRAIVPHALTAHWQRDSGRHAENALPAGTIDSSVEDLADIGSIAQPLASFGGRPAEDDKDLAMRLGERLRHKERALLSWDYERLVLERFPEIWKVVALPARGQGSRPRPGSVRLIVVPGPDTPPPLDPTAPLLPRNRLRRIEDFLVARTSPWVELTVANPTYVRIAVTATVEIVTGHAVGAALEELEGELIRYLSPWFYDAARAATEGRYASPGEIAEFIQSRPSVAALSSLDLAYDPDLEEASRAPYFLTSATRHWLHTDSSSSLPCPPASLPSERSPFLNP